MGISKNRLNLKNPKRAPGGWHFIQRTKISFLGAFQMAKKSFCHSTLAQKLYLTSLILFGASSFAKFLLPTSYKCLALVPLLLGIIVSATGFCLDADLEIFTRFCDSTAAQKLHVISLILFGASLLVLILVPKPHNRLALVPFIPALIVAGARFCVKSGRMIIKSFCDCTSAKKLYVISPILYAVTYPLIFLLPNLHRAYALIPFWLGTIVAAAAICLELYHPLRRILRSGFWRGLLRKVIFLGLIVSLAGLMGRKVLYDIVHENPEAFPWTEAALGILFIPVVSIALGCFCAVVGMTIFGAGTMLCMFLDYLSFGLFERPLRPLVTKGLCRLNGLFGLFLLLIFMFQQLVSLSSLPQAKLFLNELVVLTGFYTDSNGQYKSLRPNSAVAFLPADRVCVAELSNGKMTFHTLRRDDLK